MKFFFNIRNMKIKRSNRHNYIVSSVVKYKKKKLLLATYKQQIGILEAGYTSIFAILQLELSKCKFPVRQVYKKIFFEITNFSS